MKGIDLCPSREYYYSQLNNEVDPYNACQVTSLVAGLDLAHHSLDRIRAVAEYEQPEDCLYHYICENAEVQAFHRDSHPGTDIPAVQWADVRVFAVNRLYGKEVVYFDGDLSASKIVIDLANHLPVTVSMRYPSNRNFAGQLSPVDGHVVLVVGLVGGNFLVNDPYKNHLSGDRDGYKNLYTTEDWAMCFKGYGIRFKGGGHA